MACLLVTLWLFSYTSAMPPKIVQIGALVNGLSLEEKKAYEFAVDSVNRDLSILSMTKLELHTENVHGVHAAAKKLCHVIKKPYSNGLGHGVAAIFGPTDEISATFIQPFCTRLGLPHVQIHTITGGATGVHWLNTTAVSIAPDVETLALAFADFVKEMHWKHILILTSNPAGLVNLKFVMAMNGLEDAEVIVRYMSSYRASLAELKAMTQFKSVIVDTSLEGTITFLRTAKDLGLLVGYYHFMFTTLDIATLAEEIGPLTTGSVNITAFQLIRSSSALSDMKMSWIDSGRSLAELSMMEKTQNALIYDGIRFFGRMLDIYLRSHEEFATKKMSCSVTEDETAAAGPWSEGYLLHHSMVPYDKEFGVTGLININADGRRTDFELDLIEFNIDGKKQPIGHWNPAEGLTITKSYVDTASEIEADMSRRKFIIAVKEEAPFVMVREYDEAGRLIPESRSRERFYGFCIDMMDALAAKLNMTDYEYLLETQGSTRQPDGTWNGIVGKLTEQNADFGISPITVTSERAEVVDFSEPYLSLGISILYKKAPATSAALFSFLDPFHWQIWACVAIAVTGTSLVLFCVARFSPGQWENPHPCSPEHVELENDLNVQNSFWFITGAMLQNGVEVSPKSPPTRIVAMAWWLFCLICIASYTANLAAFLTKSKMKTPIKNADDLSKQSEIKYGCYRAGTTREFFRNSNISTYMKMNTFMEQNPEVLVDSTVKGIAKVMEGNYAYIMESIPLRYEKTKNCELEEIGKELNEIHYAVALPKNSPYTSHISEMVLKLKQEQTILRLYDRWWQDSNKCKEEVPLSDVDSSKLGLPNFMGVFIILYSLLGIALIVCVFELCCGAFCGARHSEKSFTESLGEEIRFAMCNCAADDKPVNLSAAHEEYEDSTDGAFLRQSLGRLSLSIGSLHTTPIAQNQDKVRQRSSPSSAVVDKESITSSGNPSWRL